MTIGSSNNGRRLRTPPHTADALREFSSSRPRSRSIPVRASQIDTVPRSVSPSTRLDSHRPRRRLTERGRPWPQSSRRNSGSTASSTARRPPTRTGRASEGGRDVVNNIGERGRNGYLSGIQKEDASFARRTMAADGRTTRIPSDRSHPARDASDAPILADLIVAQRTIAPPTFLHPQLYSPE